MSTIFLPTSCLLDKSVVREALRGLVHETIGAEIPPRQEASLKTLQTLLAYGSLLYITPELFHLLTRPAHFPLTRSLLPSFRVLTPGRYLRRWCRRLTEEGFSHEDALIISYASFGFDRMEKTFGVETVLTNDLRMRDRYGQRFSQIETRFVRMTSQLRSPYQHATLPEVMSVDVLWSQMAV